MALELLAEKLKLFKLIVKGVVLLSTRILYPKYVVPAFPKIFTALIPLGTLSVLFITVVVLFCVCINHSLTPRLEGAAPNVYPLLIL